MMCIVQPIHLTISSALFTMCTLFYKKENIFLNIKHISLDYFITILKLNNTVDIYKQK